MYVTITGVSPVIDYQVTMLSYELAITCYNYSTVGIIKKHGVVSQQNDGLDTQNCELHQETIGLTGNDWGPYVWTNHELESYQLQMGLSGNGATTKTASFQWPKCCFFHMRPWGHPVFKIEWDI